MSFVEQFSFSSGDDEPGDASTHRQPAWLSPPENELGVAVPQGIVIARAERGVVALSHVVAYSSGVTFDFIARARDLSHAQANRLFHEQHVFDEEELPDGLLRLGFELADGSRVSNLGWRKQHRRLMTADEEPDGPVLNPHAGGGGSSSSGEVTMRPGYWLWPLPPPGPIRISCEWPLLSIAMTTVEIDARELREAAADVLNLWEA